MIRAMLSIAGELISLFWARKLWWMIPIVGVLLLLSALLVASQTSPLVPVIYTLF